MKKHSLIIICFVGLVSATEVLATDRTDAADIHALIKQTMAELVFVKGGTFMMGDVGSYITKESYKEGDYKLTSPTAKDAMHLRWTNDKDNKPPVKVTLTGYSMDKYELTFGEYDVFTKATGRPLLDKEDLGKNKFRGPRQPAATNWYQSKAYCQWLGKITGLPFDLPTEAQWEYAARSRGRPVGYATDTGLLDIPRNDGKFIGHPYPVGSFPPNPLGMHDMTDNVAEWVNDWYAPGYADLANKTDPTGPKTGTKKVNRGGSYAQSAWGNDVYSRVAEVPDTTNIGIGIGFRCVLNVDHPVTPKDVRTLSH